MIDAHHHIWQQKDLPWLLGPEQPRIFGSYEAIKRDYLIKEYLQDVSSSGIEKSVYVQANWAPNWWADEIAWVETVAEDSGWPNAIVGFLDFAKGDVASQLKQASKFKLLRGFRQQYHWHENPLYCFAPDPKQFCTSTVKKNIEQLADYGWSFDLQVFPSQMKDAAALAKACPEVTFVLQHAGMLEDQSKTGWKNWRDGIRRLADLDNVVSKLSAFGTFIHRNDPEFIDKIVRETIGMFGARRCMFGSNFPIEKLWTDYGSLVDAFRRATTGLPKGQQKAIFNDTAERVYRLN